MSLIASLGAIEIGLIFGLVALGVYLSFRIINFPDLTVDGSFPLGGAVAAALIVAGWQPVRRHRRGHRRRCAGRLRSPPGSTCACASCSCSPASW